MDLIDSEEERQFYRDIHEILEHAKNISLMENINIIFRNLTSRHYLCGAQYGKDGMRGK